MEKLNKQDVYREIAERYGDDPYCYTSAKGFFDAGMEYVDKLPYGWNVNDNAKQLKRLKKDHEKRIRAYVKANYLPPPKGFIESFIFMAILSGIISWVTQRILNYYFPDFWKKSGEAT